MKKMSKTICNNAGIDTTENGYIRFNGHNYRKGFDLITAMSIETGGNIGKNFAQSIGYSIDINREWYWSYTLDNAIIPTESIMNRLLDCKSVNKNAYWKPQGNGIELASYHGHELTRRKVNRKDWTNGILIYLKRIARGETAFPLVNDTWLFNE